MEYGCPSLHKYVVNQLKYSPAESWTRISAMRLIRDSAPALNSLAQGKLTLSNASLSQENKKNIKEENFDQILKLAEEKSFRELENILNEIKSPSQSPRPKKIELSVAILEKMKRLKKYYDADLSEVEMIEALLDKELKQQETEVKKITRTDHTKATRYIPKTTRAFVLKKAKRSIYEQSVEERDLGALIVPMGKDDYLWAQKEIKKLRRKIMARTNKSLPKNQLICFSTQLFSLLT